VGIALDIVRQVDGKFIDEVILGTNDPNMVDSVLWCKEKGLRVMIYSIRIPIELRETADYCVEIKDNVIDFFEEQVLAK
jgi:uncharacterized LabA/DUF88 family protein